MENVLEICSVPLFDTGEWEDGAPFCLRQYSHRIHRSHRLRCSLRYITLGERKPCMAVCREHSLHWSSYGAPSSGINPITATEWPLQHQLACWFTRTRSLIIHWGGNAVPLNATRICKEMCGQIWRANECGCCIEWARKCCVCVFFVVAMFTIN